MLPPTGAIEVSGSDRKAFLQGQLTNDIRQVGPRTSQLSAWCNPQGRVITTLRVVEVDDALLLLLPADQVQHVAERLRKFVLRADVRLGIADGSLPGIGLRGQAVRARLEQAGWQPPAAPNAVTSDAAALLIRVPDVRNERFELYARSGDCRSLAARIEVRVSDDAGNTWRAWNIEAGLPVVYTVNRERFLPQMLNLDQVHGVSFAKGCYAGQEIVARTQNLGRVKRRMRRFSAEASSAAGDAVFVAGSPVGSVVEVASRDDRVEMLAVVPLIADESFTLGTGNVRLQELPLVY